MRAGMRRKWSCDSNRMGRNDPPGTSDATRDDRAWRIFFSVPNKFEEDASELRIAVTTVSRSSIHRERTRSRT